MPQLLLILHLLLFLFSFAFTAGISILLVRVARQHDARVIHATLVSAAPLSAMGGMGWLLTALSGVALAMAAGIPLDQPWLLYSYGAFAVLFGVGVGIHKPWHQKIMAAAAASPDGGRSPELEALLKSPVPRMASTASLLAILALLYLMTARMG